MKKLLAMLLALMLALCAVSALAEPGEADIAMNGTQYHLTLDSVEIRDGRLYIVIGGLAQTMSFGANGLQLAASAVPYYDGEALYASDKDILFGEEVTFRFDRDTLPEEILLEPTEEGQESVLIWENDEANDGESTAATIPDVLVGTWRGTGTPKNGGPSIDLAVTVNADGSGEYTFDQGSYHESYPFTISNDDSTFSVDISATDMLASVGGSWALEDGRLMLDITTEFASGGSYAYIAECEKVDETEEAPDWAGVEWQLDTLYFKTLSEDSPYSIDAGMSLNGSATYGSRLRLEGGSVKTDIDLNGLIEAVPQLPFSVPELDLTQYDSYTAAGNDLLLTPGEVAFALGDDAESLSLSYTTHVEVQSQTLGNGLTSQAGETDLEITLGFVRMSAEQVSEPTEELTPEPTEEPTPEPTEEPTPEPTPEPTEEPTPEPTEEPTPESTPVPEYIDELFALRDRAEENKDGEAPGHEAYRGRMIVAIFPEALVSDAAPEVITSESENTRGIPAEYLADSWKHATRAVVIFPQYADVGIYTGGGVAKSTTTWMTIFNLSQDVQYHATQVAHNDPPQTIQTQKIGGMVIPMGAAGEYEDDTAIAMLVERADEARAVTTTPEPTEEPTPEPAEETTPEPTEEPEPMSGEIPVEAVLDALEDDVYRTTYDALLAGEEIAKGSKGETARGIQQTLAAFGQSIAVDGSVGSKTIAALNAVQAAFGLEATESLDAGGYAALLPRLLTVTDPDAAEALLSDALGGEFEYMRACACVAQGKYYSAKQAFEESGWGDFEARAAACAQDWPKTGQLYKNPDVKGSSTRLSVQFNSDANTAMLVKIYTTDDVLARTLFIGGTGKATTSLPAGTYVIKDGTGTTWYGEEEAFGEEGYYEIMTFGDGEQQVELKRNYASTITVNVQEANPDAEGVGADWESWGEF